MAHFQAARALALRAIALARQESFDVGLLTGDSSPQGPLLARELGIGSCSIGLEPQQKMQHVQSLQDNGAVVAMVGEVETLVSSRLPPGVSAITEADRRGTILAIMHLSRGK